MIFMIVIFLQVLSLIITNNNEETSIISLLTTNSTSLSAAHFQNGNFSFEMLHLDDSLVFSKSASTSSFILLDRHTPTASNVSLRLKLITFVYSLANKTFLSSASLPVSSENIKNLNENKKQVILDENRLDPNNVYLSYQVFKIYLKE